MNPSCKKKTAVLRAARLFAVVAVLALQFIAAGTVAAGLPDKDQLATGKPERKLSGILVGIRPLGTRFPNGTPISKIIRLYGPPTSKEDAVVPDGAGGTRFYKWEWPGLRMSVATFFYYCRFAINRNMGVDDRSACGQHPHQMLVESHPAYIDVWGDAPRGALGVTGRGLQLGDTLERQKAIYGDRYSLPYAEKGTTSVLMDWEDGTELTVDYGPGGRSNHIRLTCRER
ncbi:MAG: hypothetical protein ABSC47_08480 [Terracidiphilus sp.]